MPIDGAKPASNKKKKKSILTAVIIIAVIGLILGFGMRIKHVDTGYIGIKSSITNPFDNSSEHKISVVKSGYVVYIPLCTQIWIYPTTVQTAAYNTITIRTNDGMEFVIKPRISYQLNADKALSFYTNYKVNLNQLNNNYLKEITAGTYSLAVSNYSSDSLIHNIGNFEAEAFKSLSSKMADAGLTLMNANPNLEIPPKIKELVEQRNLAKHNMLLAQDKFQEVYAKTNVERVKDSLLNSALTSLAIQKMFIEKWDGKLSPEIESPKAYRDINQAEASEK